ncbi:MAG TPA: hypothetical protein V6D47_04710 [Oscillatoriaceae cyanobacterium]
MSSAYDQQIKKLVDHIQSLNQALHERNMQIMHWQQVARAVQDERARLARGLMDQVKTGLTGFSTKFQGLRAENKKLRAFIDHQKQLHETMARDAQGQLQYALARIDELAQERAEWRNEVQVSRAAAIKYQQQVQEQKGVIGSQQAALSELRAQLEVTQGYAEVEIELRGEIEHLREEVQRLQGQRSQLDSLVAGKEREARELREAFETFQARAAEELQAVEAELTQFRAQQGGADERVDELTKLLANSEREVAKLFAELGKERELRKEAEIRLDTFSKEVKSLKTKNTKLTKESEAAKGKQLSMLQKQVEELNRSNQELQEALTRALEDKTQYMQAVEGNKGKLRSVPPPAEQGPGG